MASFVAFRVSFASRIGFDRSVSNADLHSRLINPPVLLKARADHVVESLPGRVVRQDNQRAAGIDPVIISDRFHALRGVHNLLDSSLPRKQIDGFVYIPIREASDSLAQAFILLSNDRVQPRALYAALLRLGKGAPCFTPLVLSGITH